MHKNFIFDDCESMPDPWPPTPKDELFVKRHNANDSYARKSLDAL
jgi:hypothetical protein